MPAHLRNFVISAQMLLRRSSTGQVEEVPIFRVFDSAVRILSLLLALSSQSFVDHTSYILILERNTIR